MENKDRIIGLHVTSLENLHSILATGLEPRIGKLSEMNESAKAVFFFHSWEDMDDAEWLFDQWPYESEPVLLAVDLSELSPPFMQTDASFELLVYQSIPPEKITVLARTELNWDQVKDVFFAMGGRKAHCPELVERFKPLSCDESEIEDKPAPAQNF